MPGMDIPLLRQVFSVALASFEFYKGEWKQSLLSGAGIFSQSAMYAGFFSKLFLNIFSFISPNLQDDIIYGAYTVTKSIIVGALLHLFQITATAPVRKKAMDFFELLACKNEAIDRTLESQGLPGQDSNLSPSLQEIQRTQSASQDWTLTCSTEFQKFIETDPFTDNVILKLIFQMLNMPTSMEEMDIKCRNLKVYMHYNKYLSFKDLLVIEAGLTKDKMNEISPPVAELAAATTQEAAATETGTGTAKPAVTPEEATAAPAATSEAKPIATAKPAAPPSGTTEGGSRHARRPSKRSSLSSSRKKRKSQPLSR
jgi:hypothetical protein